MAKAIVNNISFFPLPPGVGVSIPPPPPPGLFSTAIGGNVETKTNAASPRKQVRFRKNNNKNPHTGRGSGNVEIKGGVVLPVFPPPPPIPLTLFGNYIVPPNSRKVRVRPRNNPVAKGGLPPSFPFFIRSQRPPNPKVPVVVIPNMSPTYSNNINIRS